MDFLHDITKEIKSKKEFRNLINLFEFTIKNEYLDEKLILNGFILIIVFGINSGYILDEEINSCILKFIEKTKNTLKLTYELGIKDILDDIKSDTEPYKKLNIKLKHDLNSDLNEAYILRKEIKEKDVIDILLTYIASLNK